MGCIFPGSILGIKRPIRVFPKLRADYEVRGRPSRENGSLPGKKQSFLLLGTLAGEKKNGSPAASGSGEPHQILYANPTKLQSFDYNHGFTMSYEALRRHLDTPRRAKVQGAVEFLRAKGIKITNEEIFQHFQVPTITGYRLLRSASRTRHNQALIETRSRKSKILGQQVTEADKILQEIELKMDGKRFT